ncbi:DUF488 domain-containing protein [Gramella sp. AN32]|uniref:DUF488 family protein n=1 Tax=Christiangramia antarctica TaxID=2058158 RepID=A0ABW5X3H1_9FLAO|nr:DUF488 domain-containing protein [Gramella sp. AN32]MCM4155715.1 Fe-S cluster assembly protein HesB [Gramella sp. AN32]
MKLEKNKKVWTIGHSTRSFEEFIEILRSFQIEQVIDIRRYPGSRKFPQFNKEDLKKSLAIDMISYTHLEILGGRRKPDPKSKNSIWRHPSFRGYADYMGTENFKAGFRELKELVQQKSSAIMCSEAVWWSCHRSMISDALKVEGWKVMHIMGLNKENEHPYTQPVKIIDGKLSYGE